MKLIFSGTPDFAALALQAIIAAGHEGPQAMQTVGAFEISAVMW